MLKKKAMRKIIITTFSIITILVLCIIPGKISNNTNFLDLDVDTVYVNNSTTTEIYLLASNNYLVKTTILINGKNLKENVSQIIKYLTLGNSSKLPNGLNSIIPSEAKLNNIEIDDKIVILDFNDKLFDVEESFEEKVVEAITYSLINLDGIEGVKLKVNGNNIIQLPKSKKNLPFVLNRNFGINKVFELDNIHNVNTVVTYYMCSVGDKNYYVPVTKYLNDDKEKIKIIIDNLSTNYIYESTLVSLLNTNIELLDYSFDDDIMTLNFNEGIFTNEKLLEEVIYPISESVFFNYDVNNIIFQINGQEIKKVKRNNKIM